MVEDEAQQLLEVSPRGTNPNPNPNPNLNPNPNPNPNQVLFVSLIPLGFGGAIGALKMGVDFEDYFPDG